MVSELASTLASVLEDHGARRVVLGAADETIAEAARSAADEAGAEVVDWRARPSLAAHHDADAGVTDVVAAVAETGSVVIGAGAEQSRGTWLLPPLHVAVVAASRIVPDLLDAGAAATPGERAYRVLVTGPSKTADIEGELVTGVHGPGAVHVVVVTDR
jgi:L-lactate dehydrogenase complex protein LldG